MSIFTNKYWTQIGSILKPDFAVVKNLTEKEKGGLAASRIYKKDSQYKLAKAIFVDAVNIIIEEVSNGHMVEVDDDIWFQVDYKAINKKMGNPYKNSDLLVEAGNKIPYIYMYYYGDRIKIIPTKAITVKMLDRMSNGYRFTRKLVD